MNCKRGVRQVRKWLMMSDWQPGDDGSIGLNRLRRARQEQGFAKEERRFAQAANLLSLALNYALALEIFGSQEKASRWFTAPTKALDDQTSLAVSGSKSGSKTVEEMLLRIDYGFPQ